jgi:hypothetical protein
LKSPAGKGDTLWQRFVISDKPDLATHQYTHGLGWGDINKDGKNDVIIKNRLVGIAGRCKAIQLEIS